MMNDFDFWFDFGFEMISEYQMLLMLMGYIFGNILWFDFFMLGFFSEKIELEYK